MNLADALSEPLFVEAWAKVAAVQSPRPTRPPLPLDALRQRVLRGQYRPQPLRRRVKAKPDGRERVLGVPSLVDKVVQRAVLLAVGRALDGQLSPRVHGYRPGRSPHTALRQLLREARGPQLELVQADISEMFDALEHVRVRAAAHRAMPDPLWRSLVDAWLAAWPTQPGLGVPQGAPLSPLLANLTLAEALDRPLEEVTGGTWRAGVSPAARLAAARKALRQTWGWSAPPTGLGLSLRTWLRYGDDLILVSTERGGGLRALRWLDGQVRAAGLRLSDRKTVSSVMRHGQPLPRPFLGATLHAVRDAGAWRLSAGPTLPLRSL
ncbi:MAG: group II intron reverse transcriptase domain-containing protein [Alphaproteobacteria bacterium]|nr:group II intron reverse transcriptase domain-containing protein [Alphaproteobacteria bacterium]